MNIKHAFGITALVGLCFSCSVQAQTGAAAPGLVPQKHSLAIPVTIPGKTIECVASCGPSIPISALAFSPDGKILAVGGYQEVLLWDLTTAKLLRRAGAGQLGGFVHAIAFSKDGRSLAVGEGTPHRTGTVRVLDVAAGKVMLSFQEPKDVVYSLAFSPDGKLLAAGGADALARIWSLAEKKVVGTIEGHGDWVLGVSFSPDGKFLATASSDNSAQVWEVGTWKSSRRMQQADTVHAAAFSADGTHVALAVGGEKDRAIRIMRLSDGRQIRAMGLGLTTPLDVIWAPKGNKIFVPCDDKTLKVYNGANGGLIANLAGHEDWVYGVAVNADETKFASGSADGTVKLWNAADNRLLATFVQLTPRTDEWLILTVQGYLTSSSVNALTWKTTDVKTSPEKLTSVFQNPELVGKAIAGEKIPPPALE